MRRQGFLDHLCHMAGFSPYQCNTCQVRFKKLRYSPPTEIPASDRGTAREIKKTRRQLRLARIKQEIYLYTLAGLIFLAFLYFIAKERG